MYLGPTDNPERNALKFGAKARVFGRCALLDVYAALSAVLLLAAAQAFWYDVFSLTRWRDAWRSARKRYSHHIVSTGEANRNELVQTLRLPTGAPFKKQPMRHPRLTQTVRVQLDNVATDFQVIAQ